jgi:hypothetical protein
MNICTIRDLLARRLFARASAWTEALAVGDRLFVESAVKIAGHRRQFTYSDAGTGTPNTLISAILGLAAFPSSFGLGSTVSLTYCPTALTSCR